MTPPDPDRGKFTPPDPAIPTESRSAPLALVVGQVTIDRTPDGEIPGGSAYYAAHALAALGARVRVLTAAGRGFSSEALRGPAKGPAGGHQIPTGSHEVDPGGIELLVLPSPETTVFENVYRADGTRSQRVHAVARALDPAALPAAWRSADLLLLAPVLGELAPAAFARAVDARVAGLCVQGLVRAVGPDGLVRPRRLEADASSLGGIGLAVLGEDEAQGQPDLVAALAAVIPLVAFTRGARGVELLSRGGRQQVGVYPTCEVDPTGAGDVFGAAMLLALARGALPADAARLGAAAASIVVEGRGGATLPRLREAWSRAALVPVIPSPDREK